jgi:hypothetical protein
LSRIITFSFGDEKSEESGRRERTIIDVMEGFWRHCWSTALPIMPVDPVRIIFIVTT